MLETLLWPEPCRETPGIQFREESVTGDRVQITVHHPVHRLSLDTPADDPSTRRGSANQSQNQGAKRRSEEDGSVPPHKESCTDPRVRVIRQQDLQHPDERPFAGTLGQGHGRSSPSPSSNYKYKGLEVLNWTRRSSCKVIINRNLQDRLRRMELKERSASTGSRQSRDNEIFKRK